MKDILNSYSKDRKLYINIIFCIVALLGTIIFPLFFESIFRVITKNEIVLSILSYVFTILALILMFYKDLINEFNRLKKNFKSSFSVGFKYYIIGIMAMVFFNLIIAKILGGVSSNENQVRDMLGSSPLYTMLCISIFAPLEEELIFRKSFQPLFKNKYIYSLICGLTFGLAHLLTNFVSGTFVISDLLYILPYGSLGFVFGLMDYETKSTCTSMIIHSIHNTITGIVLLLIMSSGVI